MRKKEGELLLENQRELRGSGQEISDEAWSAVKDFIKQATWKPGY